MRPRALTMLGTIAKKLAQCIVVLFLLSLAVFYMAHLGASTALLLRRKRRAHEPAGTRNRHP